MRGRQRGNQPADQVPRRRSRWWQGQGAGAWWGLGALTVLGLGLLGGMVHLEDQVLTLRWHGVRSTVTVVQAVPDKHRTSYRVHFSPSPRDPSPPADLWAPNVRGSVGQVIEVAYLPSDPNNVTPTADLGPVGMLLPGLLGVGALFCFAFAVVGARS